MRPISHEGIPLTLPLFSEATAWGDTSSPLFLYPFCHNTTTGSGVKVSPEHLER
jgi:hypothetical protein